MHATGLQHVLVVEDDADLAELVRMHLVELGLAVDVEHDGLAAAGRLAEQPYDLVVLDLNLPGMDGTQLCRRIRMGPEYIGILILSARGSELDRIVGLENGADDYLAKPFSVLELIARVKAILRRAEAMQIPSSSQKVLSVCGVTIDMQKRLASVDGKAVELTAKEFDLLLFFAEAPGRVFSRAELLHSVWGYHHAGYAHTVNSHINRLRTKIEADPLVPRLVLTVWGVGYKFCDAPKRSG